MSDLTNKSTWSGKWEKKTNKRTWTLGEKTWNRFFNQQLSDLDENAHILELGCAPGSMVERMNNVRPNLYIDGIDFSDTGIKKATAVYQRNNIKGKLHQQDIRDPLDQDYDIVCSYGLIEHFDNPEDILSFHIDKLKHGGKLIVTVPNFVSKPAKWALPRFSPETLKTHNLNVMNEKYLNDVLETLGLQNIQTGSFGGSLLPAGSLKKSTGSFLYKKISSLWNVGLSAVNFIIDVEKIAPWQSHIFAIGYKKPIKPD